MDLTTGKIASAVGFVKGCLQIFLLEPVLEVKIEGDCGHYQAKCGPGYPEPCHVLRRGAIGESPSSGASFSGSTKQVT